MDHDLDSNWEWGLNKILKHRDIVEAKHNAKQKHSSKEDYKATKRMGNELVYNPYAYGDYLEDARSKDLDGGRIVRDLLNVENKPLGNGPTSQKLFPGDTVHHWYAQRTGGDTIINLPHPERHRFHERLDDSKYTLGNRIQDGDRNLWSFMRSFHLNSDALKQQEANALNPLGAKQAKDLNTPKAHRVTGNSVTGTFSTQSGADAFKLMVPQLNLQNKDSQAAYDVMNPIRQRIQALVGMPNVNQGSSGLEKKELRQAITDNAPAVEALIRKEMSPLLKLQQTEVLKRALGSAPKSLLSALPIPVISQAFGAIETAERTAQAAKTKDPLDVTQATLAGAGMTPVVGTIADLSNTVIDAVRWLANPLTRTNLNKGASKAFTGAHTGRY